MGQKVRLLPRLAPAAVLGKVGCDPGALSGTKRMDFRQAPDLPFRPAPAWAMAGRMRQGFPLATAGMVIGLLGGSFDPAHAAHVHVTRESLKRFALDRVWWLVSPGNPLKEQGPAPMAARIAHARGLLDDPRVEVTDIEARLGTRYTAETLAALVARYDGVRFVWLMGADNLAQLHRWQDWRWIADNVPMGVLARPRMQMAALSSPAARIYRDRRIPDSESHRLGRAEPPAWCFVHAPLLDISSTRIRESGAWGRA